MDITNINENMGNADRVFRALLAVVAAAAYFNGLTSGVFGILTLVVTWVFLATAIFGLCPLYSLLGIRTKIKKRQMH